MDFLDAIQSIPLERLTGDKIQIKWMEKLYPHAAKIAYAVTGLPIGWQLKWWYPPVYQCQHFWNRAWGKLTGFSKINMNPFVKWDQEKPWIRAWSDPFFAEILEQTRSRQLVDASILEQLERQYRTDARVRINAVTIAACWKEFLL